MFTSGFETLILAVAALSTTITQVLKKRLGLQGLGAVALSVVVTAVVAAIEEIDKGWDTVEYIILTFVASLVANGAYKLVKKAGGES